MTNAYDRLLAGLGMALSLTACSNEEADNIRKIGNDPANARALLNYVKSDNSSYVAKVAAIDTLAAMHDKDAIPFIEPHIKKSLGNGAGSIFTHEVDALEQLDPVSETPKLIGWCATANTDQAVDIVWAIAKTGNKDALRQIISGSNATCRTDATAELARMTPAPTGS